jgi:hypothetical protein
MFTADIERDGMEWKAKTRLVRDRKYQRAGVSRRHNARKTPGWVDEFGAQPVARTGSVTAPKTRAIRELSMGTLRRRAVSLRNGYLWHKHLVPGLQSVRGWKHGQELITILYVYALKG